MRFKQSKKERLAQALSPFDKGKIKKKREGRDYLKVRIKNKMPESEQKLKGYILDELRPKDAKIFKELKKDTTTNNEEIVRNAGVSSSRHAAKIVRRILRNPGPRAPFRALLIKKGVDLDYRTNHIKSGLESTRTISVVLG